MFLPKTQIYLGFQAPSEAPDPIAKASKAQSQNHPINENLQKNIHVSFKIKNLKEERKGKALWNFYGDLLFSFEINL